MAELPGSLSTSPVASDPEDGLKACLAQSRKQRGADIHSQSPGIILILSMLKMERLNCYAGS